VDALASASQSEPLVCVLCGGVRLGRPHIKSEKTARRALPGVENSHLDTIAHPDSPCDTVMQGCIVTPEGKLRAPIVDFSTNDYNMRGKLRRLTHAIAWTLPKMAEQ